MSSISNNTNRVTGLVSGLDTEELVKAMTANTKSRLNSKKQKLQTLQWKQESYRSIISKISDFKDKYLNILSSNSIKANAVMKKCTATSSNTKVITATASSGAAAATYTISQAKAATTASLFSNGSVSNGAVKLDFSNAVAGKTYDTEINLDGITKKISFTAGADEEATKANFLAAANTAVSEFKGSNQRLEFKDGSSTLVFNDGGDGIYHTFGIGANIEGLGLKFNTSSKITTYSTLGSNSFNQELVAGADGKYSFNINGVDFEFDNNTTISDLINEVNNSDAGVKLSFSNASQSFTLETKDTGAAAEINMFQSSGNLLNSLFNMDSSKLGNFSADKATVKYDDITEISPKLSSVITNKLASGFAEDDDAEYALNINIDGKDLALELDLSALVKKADDKDDYTTEEINEALASALKKAYTNETGNQLTDDILSFEYNGSSLKINSDSVITIGENDLYLNKGLTNSITVNADANYVIAKGVDSMTFNVDGNDVTVNASTADGIKIQDLVDAGIVVMETDGTMIAAGDISAVDPAASNLLNTYFGKDSGLIGAKDTDYIKTRGSNGTITVSSDGETFMTYTSATNKFTFDGTNINLSDTGNFVAASEDDYIVVDTKSDTSGIKDVIVKFVDDYNKLLEELYDETSTSRPKSNGSYYDPLTEEQKEEMSDDEIKNWEENAKEGLLYRDSTVQRFISELRNSMNTVVDGFTLSSMGITLTDKWEDHGKLKIDESQLENAIEAYGDKIADFFTSENGLAAKLEATVDKAISTKTDKYGYLTSLAGMANTKTDTDNLIYQQMKSIQKLIDSITEKYENEQERYWSKFSALETYMSQMNQQASYFMSE